MSRTVVTSARISKEEAALLRALAEQNGTTVNGVLCKMIREELRSKYGVSPAQ